MKLVRRLTLTLLIGIGVIMVSETYLSVRQFAQFYDADVRRDLQVIGSVLQNEIEMTWPDLESSAAAKIVEEANRRDRELRMSWVPLEGDVETDRTDLAALREGLNEGASLVRVEGDGAERGKLSTYLPVRFDGRLVGAIEISESASPKRRFVRARLVQRGATALAMVVLCGALAWVAGTRLVGRPVGQLMEQARRIGSGDFSTRLDLRGGDELSELAQSMNAMAEQLAESRVRLDEETAARVHAIEQLRHADRLTTIGTLASGLAHELGTPLNVIAGRAQMIASGEASAPQEAAAMARVIRSQADRMVRIVRQLLDFARRRSEEKTETDLQRLTRNALLMLRPLAEKKRVSLAMTGPDETVAPAIVDAAQLEQVVTNLVVNAIQATPEGGSVQVSVAHELRASAAAPEAAPVRCVWISIRDQGAGIEEDHLPRIFDPFFTTKAVGEGTGLGLAVAHGIISEHGGWIEVESRRGEGSAFSIVLPVVPGSA